MLKNENYNLLEEIVQVSQSLYRFGTYVKDAQQADPPCDKCAQLWQHMRDRSEEDLQLLTAHLKEHMDEGRVETGENLIIPKY